MNSKRFQDAGSEPVPAFEIPKAPVSAVLKRLRKLWLMARMMYI
jgi:hypothetical protein